MCLLPRVAVTSFHHQVELELSQRLSASEQTNLLNVTSLTISFVSDTLFSCVLFSLFQVFINYSREISVYHLSYFNTCDEFWMNKFCVIFPRLRATTSLSGTVEKWATGKVFCVTHAFSSTTEQNIWWEKGRKCGRNLNSWGQQQSVQSSLKYLLYPLMGRWI